MGEHFCSKFLFPGECIVCVGKPRPFIRIESWAGSERVEVELLKRTPKRYCIRFLEKCSKGNKGAVRYVAHDVVRFP